MFKKAVGLIMCAVLVFLCCPIPVRANQVSTMDNEEGYLLEETRVNAIRALYTQRAELAQNIEENREAILKIDDQLESLGVEEISREELASKLDTNLAQPMANCPPNSSTKWLSYRTIYVYRGTQYEIQQITGTPNIPDSQSGITSGENYTLMSTVYAGIDKIYGTDYAVEELIRFTTRNTLEYAAEGTLDLIGTAFPSTRTACALMKNSITSVEDFYEAGRVYEEALSPTTVFDNVSYLCTVGMVATEEYVFVKTPGTPDEGHQIFAYAGNQIECAVGVMGSAFWVSNGTATPIILHGSTNFVIRSAYYANSFQRAVMTYLEYKQGYTTTENHLLGRVNLEFYGSLTDEYQSIHNGDYSVQGEKVILTIDVPVDMSVLYAH